jgi:hypothetical protein
MLPLEKIRAASTEKFAETDPLFLQVRGVARERKRRDAHTRRCASALRRTQRAPLHFTLDVLS